MTALGGTVAVTGATGFVGTRVVEYLLLGARVRVRALVRSYSKLARLAELPQERLSFHVADVLDPQALEQAFEGCDVVVHCAYGSSGDDDLRRRTTVDGTANVLDRAEAAGVRRLVHLSTAAVYDTRGRTVLDEETPRIPEVGDASYEQAKLRAERTILDASRAEVLVLQPTIVYGPWGNDWTIAPLARVAAGTEALPSGDGAGVCNAVYVDDVARAVVLACAADASHEAVLVTGDERPTWGRFYDAFRSVAGAAVPAAGARAVEPWEQALYADRAAVRSSRARELLGFVPVVEFADGMELVTAWARWIGIAPNPEGG